MSTTHHQAIQQAIRSVFEENFPLALEFEDSSFESLGADSLSLLRLYRKISENTDQISLLEFLTYDSYSALVNCFLIENNRNAIDEQEIVLSDIDLPEELVPHCYEVPNQFGSVVLSGASGFVGAHILEELFSTTERSIVCIARGGKDSVATALKRYAIDIEISDSRITILNGDVSLSLWGLDELEWTRLCHSSDIVIHCAAMVNHAFPFNRLYDTNVKSVVEAIRLCSEGRRKRLHLISTVAVFSSAEFDHCPPNRECLELDHLPRLSDGYSATKVAAEHLIQLAHARKFDVLVHRLPTITGGTVSRICNQKDWIWAVVRLMVELKANYPDFADSARHAHLLAPVDEVCRLIVKAVETPYDGKCVHAFPEKHVEMSELTKALRIAGYQIDDIKREEWDHRVNNFRKECSDENRLWIIDEKNNIGMPRRRQYFAESQINLLGAPINRPTFELLVCYIQQLADDGFLPKICHSEKEMALNA